jgi:hypothetical protein
MQGLLAKLNSQKNPNLGSRSTSIASSISVDDEEQQGSNSDDQQSNSNTLK